MNRRTLGRRREYAELPAPVTGYALDADWRIVVPPTVDITNLVTNPSVETDTTGYTAVGGAIARIATWQRRGAWGLEVTPGAGVNNGVYFGPVTTAAGRHYPWSFDFQGGPGVPYTAYWATTGGVRVGAAVNWRGTGTPQRIRCPYYEDTATTRRLYVLKDNSASTALFYLDGLLVPSPVSNFDEWRYFDGDNTGFIPNLVEFYWSGTPHGSTSVMRAHTRAGGVITPLANYGFTLLAMLGLGLGPAANISIPLALPGGEQYQRTLGQAREFDLVGQISADNFSELQRLTRGLQGALDVRRQPITQPVILVYQHLDECGEAAGERLEIVCSPEPQTLGGRTDNHYIENLDLRFRVHVPYLAGRAGTEGAALDVRTELADANRVVLRDGNGIWSDLQSGLTGGSPFAFLWLPDGRLLIGGSFTNAGGVADADRLAIYDPATDTFSAVNATPLSSGTVTALLLLTNDTVLVGGDFTNAGGDADADRLCYLTISTGAFSTINATPLSAGVRALALLPDGTIAVGGSFTNAGGDADADYLCRLTPSTGAYSSFSSVVLSDFVTSLELSPSGTLWVGGNFTNVDGAANQDYLTALRYPAYDTFNVVLPNNNPLVAAPLVLRTLSSGSLLVGGAFFSVNGDTTWNYIFLGTPAPAGGPNEVALLRNKIISDLENQVNCAIETAPGVVMIGGTFDSVGDLTLFDRMLQFAGTTILPVDIDLPGSATIQAISFPSAGGAIAIGYTTDGSAYTSGTTTVTNSGSADAFPVITIAYDSAATVVAPLYSIRNLDTAQVISFNLSLLPGETLTLDLRPGQKTVTSSIRGDLSGTVLPGSNLSTFRLIPGSNRINIFISIDAAANASAFAWWTPNYAALDDAVGW